MSVETGRTSYPQQPTIPGPVFPEWPPLQTGGSLAAPKTTIPEPCIGTSMRYGTQAGKHGNENNGYIFRGFLDASLAVSVQPDLRRGLSRRDS